MEFKTQTVKNEVLYHVDEWTKYFWKYLPFSYVLKEISPEEKKNKKTYTTVLEQFLFLISVRQPYYIHLRKRKPNQSIS